MGLGFTSASLLTTLTAIPVSGIPLSILFGLALSNNPYMALPSSTKPGLTFSTKTVLQTGIVCVAAKLSFTELLTTGATGIPVVLSSVGAGMLFIPWFGSKLGVDRKTSLLLTAGTSICGVTAITALAPSISAPPRSVAIAVGNTVAFGTLGMLFYPYIAHDIYLTSCHVGTTLGTGIHDTSQVLGAGACYEQTYGDQEAMKAAAVTKLTRNLGLAACIPYLTYKGNVEEVEEGKDIEKETMSGLSTFTKYVPPFLYAFLGVSVLRTGTDFFDMGATQAFDFVGKDCSKYLLGTAMAGVGLSTKKEALQGVGYKPFAVGAAGATVVGGTGYIVGSFFC